MGHAPSLMRGLARAMDQCGLLKAQFQRRRGLRILCYHGVCADEFADAPWLPTYFVTASNFAWQMEMLCRFGESVRLADVFGGAPDAPPRDRPTLAVTFDDVAACTLAHAQPVLSKLGIRASFYVATNHVTTGRLFDADVLRLLRCGFGHAATREPLAALLADPRRLKRSSMTEYGPALDEAEADLRSTLPPEVHETLRPLTWQEVGTLIAAGHEIGGHSAEHAILSAQPPEVRHQQIHDSVQALDKFCGRVPLGFAYPNGGPGDFSTDDQKTLQAAGVRYAVTTRAGFADTAALYDLPRVCIGLGHTRGSVALELSGLLDARRRRQQGWH